METDHRRLQVNDSLAHRLIEGCTVRNRERRRCIDTEFRVIGSKMFSPLSLALGVNRRRTMAKEVEVYGPGGPLPHCLKR
jgi:hypothetical protein